MEERYAKIEREILLERCHILCKVAGIDNKNDAHKYAGSMNKVTQSGMQRITRENQAILRRIQACDHVTIIWSGKKIHEKRGISENISEYPVHRLRKKLPSDLSEETSLAPFRRLQV